MEDLLEDREQWIVMNPGIASIGMSAMDWDKLERRARSTIRIYLADSVFMDMLDEYTAKKLWEKLGNLYQFNSLVNKLFL